MNRLVLLPLLLGQVCLGSVIYDYSANVVGNQVGFQFESPDYLTPGSYKLPLDQITCNPRPVGNACAAVTLSQGTLPDNDPAVFVDMTVKRGDGYDYLQATFQNATLQQDGVYQAYMGGSTGQGATLTITDPHTTEATSATPEPATWGMLAISGFALLASARLKRRHS